MNEYDAETPETPESETSQHIPFGADAPSVVHGVSQVSHPEQVPNKGRKA